MRVQTLLCPPDYLQTPPTIQEDLANGLPNLDCHPSFSFGFGFFASDPHQFHGNGPSLRSWAGLVEDKYCNVDVEDELLHNREKTSGAKLFVLHVIIVFSSLVNRGF